MHGWRLVLLTGLMLAGASACYRTTPAEHLERAQAYRAANELRSAVIELKNGLQKKPDFAEARLALGEVDLELGDYPSALKELERALDLGIDQTRVMPPLLEAKLEQGHFQDVLGAVESMPSTPRVDVIRGRALLMSGESAQAVESFHHALDGDPNSVMALLGLAQVAMSVNDPAEASRLLARAVAADPKSRRALLAQADLLALQSQLDAALAAYQAAAKLPGVDLMPQLGVARVFVQQGKLDDADAAVDAVLARVPEYPLANYLKGLIAFQRSDYQGAEAALRKVQQYLPDHPATLLLMATVKFRQGDRAQAESQIGRYLTFDSNNVSARKLLAVLRLMRNNASGAVDALEPIAAGLQDAQGLALLGTAYLRAGKLDRATAYLQQAVTLAPDMAILRTQLALGLLAAGDNQSAISQLETAVGLDGDVTHSDVLLIMIRLRQHDFERAFQAAEQMTARDPDNPIGYNLLGAAYLAKQDRPAAARAFQRALVADKTFSPAAVNLAKLAQSDGDTAGARANLETLLANDPNNEAALMGLAEIATAGRDLAAAKDYLERARSGHPDAVAPRITLGRLLLATNAPDAAEVTTAEALALDPDNFDALALHAQALILSGRAGLAEPNVNKLQLLIAKPATNPRALIAVAALERQIGYLDRARENFLRVLAAAPTSQEVLIALTRLEIQGGDTAAARARLDELRKAGADQTLLTLLEGDIAAGAGAFDAAVKSYRSLAKKGNRDATMKLAAVQAGNGHTTEARATLAAWLKKHPDDFGAEVALAGITLGEGDKSAALVQYEALRKKRDDSPIVLNNLAWLYLEAGDVRAEEAARAAHALAPHNPEVADTLGWVLVQQNAADAALKLLEPAAAARSKDATIHYHLAAAYERANRSAEARRAVDWALALGDFPERADAQALRGRL